MNYSILLCKERGLFCFRFDVLKFVFYFVFKEVNLIFNVYLMCLVDFIVIKDIIFGWFCFFIGLQFVMGYFNMI